MINIEELGTGDIGRWVIYTDPFTKEEDRGRLKSWNEKSVFVVFRCGGNWAHFQEYTAPGCDPPDVRFESDRAKTIDPTDGTPDDTGAAWEKAMREE